MTNLRDHRDFEKEFEVATRLKGEHASGTHQVNFRFYAAMKLCNVATSCGFTGIYLNVDCIAA